MCIPSIQDLQSHSNPAWSWFVHEFAGPVRHYAKHLGHPDPDEVAGATFEAVVKRIHSFQGNQPELRSFVFSVAHARIVDEFRRSHHHRMMTMSDVPEAFDENGQPTSTSVSATMKTALTLLSPKQRQLVLLRYVDGATIREAAFRVGESEGATRVALSRSLKKLREHLEDTE